MQIGTLSLKNKVIVAPMSGISDSAFRRIMKRFGPALIFTEMVSATALVRGQSKKTTKILVITEEEKPVGAQIFGRDPKTISDSAKIAVDKGADLIDVNMGCSVRKVVNGGCGASLLKEPELAGEIIGELKKSVNVPVTAKIRSGWDDSSINFLEVGKILQEGGADAITLHPRTAVQGFRGLSDWKHIAELKNNLKIPVIGNGDVKTPDDAKRMLEETKCDAVMLARGVLGNPWLARRIVQRLEGNASDAEISGKEKTEVILEHCKLIVELKGEVKGIREMRKHLIWYSKGLPGSAEFRRKAMAVNAYAEFEEVVRGYFNASRAFNISRC